MWGSLAGNVVPATLYNKLGQPTQVQFGNGMCTNFGYWDVGGYYDTTGGYYGRLWEVKTYKIAGPIQDVRHAWDAGGNLLSRYDVNADETETFTYDFLDRLNSVSGPYSHTYSYNPIGNILSMNGTSYTYGTKPHAVTAVGSTSYSYDANGNMISRGGTAITWDAENRPTVIGNATFVYDGDGSRVKKTEGGQTTVYVNKYYEKNLSTGAVTTYYYLGDRLVAHRNGSSVYYVHQDHLTGTSVVTNSSGTVAGSIKYYPYGSTRSSSGSLYTDKKFTGQRLDATGLYYYGARYYDPTIGRFISADPVAVSAGAIAALNRYSYTYNNPLRYVDPSGLDVVFVNGFGSTDPDSPEDWEESEWAAIIGELGLIETGEAFIFFDWEGPGSLGGSQLTSTARAAEMLANQIAGAQLTDIKLIGFSKGGAVIMEYLSQMAEGARAANPEIKKAITVNSPLGGGFFSVCVGFERYCYRLVQDQPAVDPARVDRLANLASRLAQRSPAMDVQLTTVVDTSNYVTHDRIPGVQAITLSTSNWLYGHFLGWGPVHGNIMDNPSEWTAQVAWK